MIGEDAALNLLGRALSLSTAQETDVYLSSQDLGLTRFAGNAVHQNVSHSNVTLNIRAVEGKRLGRATTNDLSDDGIRRAMEAAKRNALLMPEDPTFPGLPEPLPAELVASWDESAAACSPMTRARMVAEVCRQGAAEGLNTAGACRTGVHEIAVVSSRGVRAYHAGTFAGLIITTRSDTSAGWAKGGSWRLDEIDYPALAREAVDKAVRGRDPQPISPGEYTVVLDHYAVDDILEALSLYGMGAQAVQEGRSWMCDLQGTRAMSESVSIWDDGGSLAGWPMPFDVEGVPRRRLELVENGVVNGPVHNTYTAAKDAVASTGHQQYFTGPPIASNLFMRPGDKSVDDLIASTERGLYITRFFYTRLSHNRGCVMTGMTRDGTFLIEDGELRHPVKDLRFTQSYVDALNGVEGVGHEARLVLNEVAFATRVPALKLASFNFTGVTRVECSEIGLMLVRRKFMEMTFDIDEEIVERLRKEADLRGETVSELVQSALQMALPQGKVISAEKPADESVRNSLPPLPTWKADYLVDVSNKEELYRVLDGGEDSRLVRPHGFQPGRTPQGGEQRH